MVISNLFTFTVITYLFLLFLHLQKMECVVMYRRASGKKLRDLKKKTFVEDNGLVLKLK